MGLKTCSCGSRRPRGCLDPGRTRSVTYSALFTMITCDAIHSNARAIPHPFKGRAQSRACQGTCRPLEQICKQCGPVSVCELRLMPMHGNFADTQSVSWHL